MINVKDILDNYTEIYCEEFEIENLKIKKATCREKVSFAFV